MVETEQTDIESAELEKIQQATETDLYTPGTSDTKKSGLAKIASIVKKRPLASGLLGGGGATGVFTLFIALLGIGSPFTALYAMSETVRDFFDNRNEYAVNERLRYHYKLAFSPDGTIDGYKDTTLKGKLLGVNKRADKIVSDLRAAGFDYEFNERGRISKFVVDGEEFSDFDKISNQRDFIRQRLSEVYPERGTIWRELKSRKVFSRFGIKRTFFENTRARNIDSALDKAKEFRKKMRERQVGYTIDPQTGDAKSKVDADGGPINAADTQKYNGIPNDIVEDANKILAESIDNPLRSFRTYAGTTARSAISQMAGRIGRSAISRGLAGLFGSGFLTAADVGCEIKFLADATESAAPLLRGDQLARFSGSVIVATDSVKAGDVNTDELDYLASTFIPNTEDYSEVDFENLSEFEKLAYNNEVNTPERGFADAEAWKWVSGTGGLMLAENEQEKFAISNGRLDFLDTVNSALGSDIGILNAGCGVITNPFVQVGGGILSALVTIASVGTFEAIDTTTAVAAGVAEGVALGIIRPVLVNMFAGLVVTGNETPVEGITAFVGGASVVHNTNAALSLGGRQLTSAELTEVETVAQEWKMDLIRSKGIAYRWFSTDHPYSLVSKLSVKMPHTPKEVVAKIQTYAISAFSIFKPERLLSFTESSYINRSTPTYADSDDGTDMFGVPQYGWTKTELNSFTDPLENATYVEDQTVPRGGGKSNAEKYREFVELCFPDNLTIASPEAEGEQNSSSPACRASSGENLRFRLYYLDESLVDSLSEYTEGS